MCFKFLYFSDSELSLTLVWAFQGIQLNPEAQLLPLCPSAGPPGMA